MPESHLTTRRLSLRPLDADDHAALHALFNLPAVGEWLWDGRAVDDGETRAAIDDSVASFAAHGWGLWGLRRHGESRLIGTCGYRPFHQPPVVELLFALEPAAWGQGLANEAATAAIAYARDRLGFATVHASTDPPNRRSAALLERLGFRFARRDRAAGVATDHYVLDSGTAS